MLPSKTYDIGALRQLGERQVEPQRHSLDDVGGFRAGQLGSDDASSPAELSP